ncbi:oligosaccharide flippase family protein [Alloacidobacterium dinghuense]|uniref:Oligosaccharide flippase family protein n=1 Tax=Alloacidobacterium dinghuense TaxID=2763107 RepID=A0A7G8BJI2_9BACT|nr:oligosaccharide flippase family protein [Alloacidobacterium dinghuense]
MSLVFQAAYFILIGRTLGSHDYGAFVGVVALVNVLSQFSSLGMEMILVRNISRVRESFSTTWGSALLISACGFAVLLILAIAIGHFTLKPELQRLIPYIALSDALFGKIWQLSSRAFQGAGMLTHTARLTALSNITRAVSALGLFLLVLVTHCHADALLWTRIYWLSSLATAIVSFSWVTRSLGWPAFARIQMCDLTDGLSFSLSSSSISVYNDIDKTLLASMGQLQAAGIYAAAYRIIDVASVPIYAIYTAATPRFFREGGRRVCNASALAGRLLRRTIPYGVVMALLLFAGSSFLPLVFGRSFRGSVEALRWLCLLPLIRGLHYAWGTTITGSASQWYRTATQLGAAGMNLLLNVALIPRWSWRGAAIASLLTDAALAAGSWVVLQYLRAKEDARTIAITQLV